MNEHKKPRGHKAHNDKDSILADAKNLLYILHPAIQRMPKIERIEGAPVEMKRATQISSVTSPSQKNVRRCAKNTSAKCLASSVYYWQISSCVLHKDY